MSAVTLAKILVEGVEKRRVDECTRPDHAGGPDYELAEEATQREAKNLGGYNEQDFIAKGKLLVVEGFLSSKDTQRERALEDNAGHYCDANVLLDIEGTWV